MAWIEGSCAGFSAMRRLLLAGGRAGDVAVESGFYDQAHLTRHSKRFQGVTPGAYAAAARR
jgi:AraC-like DNA-binding protein